MEMIDVTAGSGGPAEVTVDAVERTTILGLRIPDVQHLVVLLPPAELARLRAALDRRWEELRPQLTPADWRDLIDVV